jgi:hypothetical protein
MTRAIHNVVLSVAVALTCLGAVLVLLPVIVRGALAQEDRA